MNNYVLISDKNYAYPALVSILSVVKNDSNAKIHLITSGDYTIEEYIEMIKKHYNFEYQEYSVTKEYDFKKEQCHEYISKIAYNLFEIKDIIKESKVLYMDSDVLLRDNIDELFEIDLTGKYLAAAYDIYNNDLVEKDLKHYGVKRNKVFNSGFILLNLDELRKSNLDEFVKNCHFNLSPEKPGGDQYIFNAFVSNEGRDNWINISCKYNFQTGYLNYSHVRRQWSENNGWGDDYSNVYDNREKEVKVFHYSAKKKPFNIERNSNERLFNNFFFKEYYRMEEDLESLLK